MTLEQGDRVSRKEYDKETDSHVVRAGTVSKVIPPKEGIPFPMYVIDWDTPNPKWDNHSYSECVLTKL